MKKSTTDKRIKLEEQIKAFEQQRKELLKQERAEAEQEKKQRQLLRGGLIEKLLPHLVEMTDSEFETFLKKSLLSTEPKRVTTSPSVNTSEPPTTPQDETLEEGGDENDE